MGQSSRITQSLSDDVGIMTGPANKILIVEDDEVLLLVAEEMFRGMGYQTLTAKDGVSALRVLQDRDDVGVIFTDMLMPKGVSGLDLCQEARRIRPNVKVLFASGYPLETFRGDGGDIPDAAFISKPYRTADLAEKLRGLGA